MADNVAARIGGIRSNGSLRLPGRPEAAVPT
jgi:hypothetical protein